MKHQMQKWIVQTRLPALLATILITTWAGGPATKPVRSLADLDAAFDSQVHSLDEHYQEQFALALTDRVKGLNALLRQAVDKKDLDTAIDLREKVKVAEAQLQAAAPKAKSVSAEEISTFEKRLKDTVWQWGPDMSVRFQANGNADNTDWKARNLLTTWKVIDRRTVLLTVDTGRSNDRYAILTFTPEADSFTGFNFDYSPLPRNHLLKK